MQGEEVYQVGIRLIPQVKFIDVICPILEGNMILYMGIISILIMFIFLIYQKKDINNS